MTKLNKVEGSKENCPSCGKEIICRTKPASGNYPAKLQWQNQDGTAHYNYDFKTDTTTCKGETNSETITMPEGTELDTKVLQKIKHDAIAVTKQKIARYIGVKEECERSGITKPEMIEMFFNSVDGDSN